MSKQSPLALFAACLALAAAGAGAAQKSAPARRPPARDWSSLSPAERLKELERLAPAQEYACLMHPEVRQTQVGDCPKCGMMLNSVAPSVRGVYGLKVVSEPAQPKAGALARLRFVVSHPQTGETVKSFAVNHEKLFHLFVVSEDMSDYQHLHPRLEPDGSFTAEAVLARPGLYHLHSDFFPAGGTPQVLHSRLSTAGPGATTPPASPARLTPDAELTKDVGGLKVTLDFGGKEPEAGALVPLRFRLADARTGRPARDLEPYLGAWGHALVLNADQSEYLHSHPTESVPAASDAAAPRGGPEVEFKTMFPAPGLYRVWTQFQRAGEVVTVSFTLKVRAAP
ncbi:MAG TPA: heavy metal-binding domain-containing protein, partial [Pyrinomonadaceae bacterium]|nr:heavy metal-binding domain-containing protein [Pyrinomonadaceae bacterium]